MLRVRVFIALLFAVPAAACAVMESRIDSDAEGIVYYVPRSLVTVTVTPRASGEVGFTFDSNNLPDIGNRYALNYRNNPFFHDRLCVTIDSTKGYLTSIEYASEDKTPAIAVALAELAGRLAGGGAPSPPATFVAPPTFAAAVQPFKITFDPLDADRVRQVSNEVNRRLGTPPGKYRIEFPDLRSVKPQRQACDGKGVCFRTKLQKVAVRVTRREGAYENELETQFLTDIYGPIGNLDLSRAFLVEKVVRLKFTDGALDELVMKKPSEALKAALLPLAVLDVLLAVPTNFVDKVTGTQDARQAYVTELNQRATALESINNSLNKLALREDPRGEAGADAGRGSDNPFTIKCSGSQRS